MNNNDDFVPIRIHRDILKRINDLAEAKRNGGDTFEAWQHPVATVNYILMDYMDTIGDASLEYEAERVLADLGFSGDGGSQAIN